MAQAICPKLGDFILALNREVVSCIVSRHQSPLNPQQEIHCVMANTQIMFDLGVNSQGEVVDGQDAVTRLHFTYSYKPVTDEPGNAGADAN